MVRIFQYYLYRAVGPLLGVVGASLIALFMVMWGVSLIEENKGRPGMFALELTALGNAPLWMILLAGMLLVNGVTMARWAAVSADLGRRRFGYGYEVNIPLPIGKLAAVNVFYLGAAVILFFALRRTMW